MRKIYVLSCCIWLSCFALGAEKKGNVPFIQEQEGESILSLSKGRKRAIKKREGDVAIVDRDTPCKKNNESVDPKTEKILSNYLQEPL